MRTNYRQQINRYQLTFAACILLSAMLTAKAEPSTPQRTLHSDTVQKQSFTSAGPSVVPENQAGLLPELGPEEDDKLYPSNKTLHACPTSAQMKSPTARIPMTAASAKTIAPEQSVELLELDSLRNNAAIPMQSFSDTNNQAPTRALTVPSQQSNFLQFETPQRQLVPAGRGTSFAPRPFNFLQFSDSLRRH